MIEQRRQITVKSVQFRNEREESWRELEGLLEHAGRHGLRTLEPNQLGRLPLLYRSALSSLSVARAIALDRALIAYLNNLALRTYLVFYAPRQSAFESIAAFFRAGFPQAVRTLRAHIIIASAVFLIGLASGVALVHGNEAYWWNVLVPSALAGDRGPASTTEALQRALTMPVPANPLNAIANALFAHNTAVALFTFGLGFLAGVPTVLLTLNQGLILGAFVELFARHGLLLGFSGWVSIHGVTEVLAFVLFGAAGLRLGELVVFPSGLSRIDALATHGPVAARVALGAAGMLAVAAVLEGYFRQSIVDTGTRLTVAAVSAVLWSVYFFSAGRRAAK